ncbi:acylphosphatase [Mechercharimyces sp. CAU 1602]|uniref:acylphosphatase n=1 Tax=Mechercharimyces sp. CAU 1602 TaxID=2973933 RepID=UPI0021619D74|nr:acylphosphatase [Mechercharimyces sp. CAU 1602]MCS1352062.1 acylphosphatase [Mechercharimyces sp. CAU 1602]
MKVVIGYHIIVHGKVQGVGFRKYTVRVARQLGVKGWVRNLPEGTVEIFVQGEQEKVDRFLRRMRKGPLLARVSDLTIHTRRVERVLKGFEVKT